MQNTKIIDLIKPFKALSLMVRLTLGPLCALWQDNHNRVTMIHRLLRCLILIFSSMSFFLLVFIMYTIYWYSNTQIELSNIHIDIVQGYACQIFLIGTCYQKSLEIIALKTNTKIDTYYLRSLYFDIIGFSKG